MFLTLSKAWEQIVALGSVGVLELKQKTLLSDRSYSIEIMTDTLYKGGMSQELWLWSSDKLCPDAADVMLTHCPLWILYILHI